MRPGVAGAAKKEKHALPVKKSGHIHVAGKCADDIGNQCGGWTITWQGRSGETTKGTTILAGIRGAAGGAQVSFSHDGSGAEGAGIGIAVIGEKPYAEMQGDSSDLHLAPEDVAVVDRLKSSAIPVIAVIVSGRPLLIDAILEKADAIIAAWLPGSEGHGVADVLFGDYKAAGKLSFTWPRGDSTSLERGNPGYKTLYAFGHGLP
jgi:beta-glucosidase